MSASTRTQIYLTEAQRRRLDEICRTRGIALAEAVREAVDAWIEMRHTCCSDALAATWGKAPEIEVPSRDEWDAQRDEERDAQRDEERDAQRDEERDAERDGPTVPAASGSELPAASSSKPPAASGSTTPAAGSS